MLKTNCYVKPAWANNGSSIRTDLPLTVVAKASKRKIVEMLNPGQLICVGEVYLRTHKGTIRIR